MFYRIKDGSVFDYADYEYAEGCLYTDMCTTAEFDKNKDNYVIENGQIIVNPNLNELLKQKRKVQFESEFFYTSLGWIKRNVTMANCTTKDFLADLLLPIKAGIELGQDVEIITYKLPDFSKEPTLEYMKSLQEIKLATPEFIQECLFQTVKDFGLQQGGNNGI